jgi:uncharacterized membrane protein
MITIQGLILGFILGIIVGYISVLAIVKLTDKHNDDESES